MKTAILFLVLIALLITTGCMTKPQPSSDDIWSLATAHKADLSIGVYITAQTVDQLFTTTEGRR